MPGLFPAPALVRSSVRWTCKLCGTGVRWTAAKHWPICVTDHLQARHGSTK